jgi:hypothetical protein
MSVTQLQNSFTNSSFPNAAKALSKLINNGQKGIGDALRPCFKKNKGKSKADPGGELRGRYNMLAKELLAYVEADTTMDPFLRNKEQFVAGLGTFLSSDSTYELVKVDFGSGSYKKVASQLSKLIKVEEGTYEYAAIASFANHIKPYALDFSDQVTAAPVKLYVSALPFADTEVEALKLKKSGIDVMVIHTDPDEEDFSSLWVLSTATEHEAFKELRPEEFMATLDARVYALHAVHFVVFDTLKRDFNANKFNVFTLHADVVDATTPLRFYKGTYTTSEDYNGHDETQLGNTVLGFPQRFEYAKAYKNAANKTVYNDVLATFVFDGAVGSVAVTSYWMTTQPIEEVVVPRDEMGELPADLKEEVDGDGNRVLENFSWTSITLPEFVTALQDKGQVGRAVLM